MFVLDGYGWPDSKVLTSSVSGTRKSTRPETTPTSPVTPLCVVHVPPLTVTSGPSAYEKGSSSKTAALEGRMTAKHIAVASKAPVPCRDTTDVRKNTGFRANNKVRRDVLDSDDSIDAAGNANSPALVGDPLCPVLVEP